MTRRLIDWLRHRGRGFIVVGTTNARDEDKGEESGMGDFRGVTGVRYRLRMG